MEVVSEGSLESISRPPSTSKRSSSRSSTRSISQVQGSLDILPPEEPSCWVRPEIEEDVVVTDLADHVTPGDDQIISSANESSLQLEMYRYSDQENPIHPTDGSDEVKGKEIPSISPEDETEVTWLKPAEAESGSESASVDQDKDFSDVDPKIQKGLEKIKKLDAILSEKINKEREVKKQRREQERLWREHIENLEKNRDAELGKQVDLGPAHMLALGAPEDTDGSVHEESPPVTPLFATQPIDDETIFERHNLPGRQNVASEHKVPPDNKVHRADSTETSHESSQDGDKNGRQKNSNKRNKKNKKTGRKDYIKRNIQLAADANNTIAMTEEEKKRLEELLSDMNNLMDEPSDNTASLTLYGNGFQPSTEEAKQLADIDLRLQSLLPAEEYDVMCGSSINDEEISSQVHTPRSEATNGTLSEESQTFGELVLHETKEMREMRRRLTTIEEELNRFQNLDHNEGILSDSLLRQLLDGSSRTTSQATTIFDRISSVATSTSCDTTSSFDNSSCITESPSPLIPSLEH